MANCSTKTAVKLFGFCAIALITYKRINKPEKYEFDPNWSFLQTKFCEKAKPRYERVELHEKLTKERYAYFKSLQKKVKDNRSPYTYEDYCEDFNSEFLSVNRTEAFLIGDHKMKGLIKFD